MQDELEGRKEINETLAHKLLHSTVRLEVEEANSIGTGFYFNFKGKEGGSSDVVIVTNNHVLPKGHAVYHLLIPLRNASGDKPSMVNNVFRAMVYQSDIVRHPNPNIDLCCIPVDKLNVFNLPEDFTWYYSCFESGVIPDENKIFDAIESITMIGYPSGYYDEFHNIPITRRGITATPLNYDYNGNPEFLIDIAAFPGSSGSPVVILDLNGYLDIDSESVTVKFGDQRLLLVGILSEGKIRTEVGNFQIAVNGKFEFKDLMHLGVAIKAREIKTLEQYFLMLRSQVICSMEFGLKEYRNGEYLELDSIEWNIPFHSLML